MRVCTTILLKLELYWRHANPIVKHKILVHDAIIKSKFLYGLETVGLNQSVKHTFDIFQLKGLRKTRHIKTTYVDRAQDRTIHNTAQNYIRLQTKRESWGMQLKRYSQVYEERKTKYLNRIINFPQDAPQQRFTFQQGTLKPVQLQQLAGTTRRQGQARVKFAEIAMDNLRHLIGKEVPHFRYQTMNLYNNEHIEVIKAAAAYGLHEITPSHQWIA